MVLNTASPGFYVEFIASALGFDDFCATPVALPESMPLLPEIEGENNKRMAKIYAMMHLLPEERAASIRGFGGGRDREGRFLEAFALENSFAYSDSPADLPMLFLASRSFLVHPRSKRLLSEKRRLGWQTLTPQRPYRNALGHFLACVRQLLGVYKNRGL